MHGQNFFLFSFYKKEKYRRKDKKNCIVIRFAYMQFYIEIQTTRQNSKMSLSYKFFIHSKKIKCYHEETSNSKIINRISNHLYFNQKSMGKNLLSNDTSKKICACQTLVIGHLLIFGILRQDFCNFKQKTVGKSPKDICKRHR